MSNTFVVEAELRSFEGKAANRRLRRLEKRIPAVIYGGPEAPKSLSIVRKDFEKLLESEAFYGAVIRVRIDGEETDAILKEIQRHPAKDFPIHADFLRVVANKAIKVLISLHFINEDTCIGVKLGGGRIQHQLNEVEVLSLPGDLPEFIEVDMQNVNLGEIVHLSDLQFPQGVVSTALALGEDYDLSVATVVAPKGAKDDDPAELNGDGMSSGTGTDSGTDLEG